MSLANGTPVFTSVGVQPAGSTDVIDLATVSGVANSAVTAASNAQTSAASAVATANSASQTAGSALVAAQASLQPSAIWSASGVAGTNASGDLAVPAGKSVFIPNGSIYQSGNSGTPTSAYYQMGYSGCSKNHTFAIFSGTSAGGSHNDFVTYWGGGTGNFDGLQWWHGNSVLPAASNSLTLGSANNTFAGLFLQSAATVVSDINLKTNIALLGADTDGIASALGVTTANTNQSALFAAMRSIPLCTFTYKDGKRTHVGTIAQFVEAAFKKQGLDPADYGLWCENTQETTTFTTDENGETTVTTTPGTSTVQTLRMEEFLALKLAQVEYDLTAKVSSASTSA